MVWNIPVAVSGVPPSRVPPATLVGPEQQKAAAWTPLCAQRWFKSAEPGLTALFHLPGGKVPLSQQKPGQPARSL